MIITTKKNLYFKTYFNHRVSFEAKLEQERMSADVDFFLLLFMSLFCPKLNRGAICRFHFYNTNCALFPISRLFYQLEWCYSRSPNSLHNQRFCVQQKSGRGAQRLRPIYIKSVTLGAYVDHFLRSQDVRAGTLYFSNVTINEKQARALCG